MSDQNPSKRKAAPGSTDLPRNPKRGSSDSPDEGSEFEMVRCAKCGRLIPRMNLALHDIQVHRNDNQGSDSPSPRSGEPSRLDCSDEEGLRGSVSISGTDDGIEVSTLESSGLDGSQPGTGAGEEAVREEDNNPSEGSVAGSTEAASGMLASTNAPTDEGDQWPCPRCTLLNTPTALQCDACLLIRPHTARPTWDPILGGVAMPPPQRGGDSIRMEVRQIDRRTVNTANSIVSGAVLGGVFGGAVGALVGAAGGAVADGIARWRNRGAENDARQPTVTVVTGRLPSGGYVMSTSNRTLPNRRGGMRRVILHSSGTGPIAMRDIDQAIMQMLMMSAMAQGHGNADQMTYEELLRQFGAGTENRGASQEVVDALPLTTISNVDSLKDNEKTCNICLEDFVDGDNVRKLSCHHCFHKNCIDRWLLQVSSCPICKRDINCEHSAERNGDQSNEMPTQEA